MLASNRLYWLLILTPIALACPLFTASDGVIFSLCALALLPLAALLGDATEQVALHTNEVLGGLLNATFGNATEVILSFFLLRAGELKVVQLSLLGSILSNTLLVLGVACIAAGVVKRTVRFSGVASSANTTMLQVAIAGLMLPTLMTSIGQFDAHGPTELTMSRFISVIFLILYALYLKSILDSWPAEDDDEEKSFIAKHKPTGDDDDDDDEVLLSLPAAIA